MEEFHVILPRVLEWLVRFMMLRQDIERCLSPCHSLGETDPRPLKLNDIKSWNKLYSFSYFEQVVRRHFIDKPVNECNSAFPHY